MHARFSRRAAAWARREAIYLGERSAGAARRFGERMEWALAHLAKFPEIGVQGALPGVRRLIVDEHILSYRRRGRTVTVLAVRHGRQRDAHAPGEVTVHGGS